MINFKKPVCPICEKPRISESYPVMTTQHLHFICIYECKEGHQWKCFSNPECNICNPKEIKNEDIPT